MKKKTIFTTVMVLVSVFAFAQCPAGQTEVIIDVSTDNWGYEGYWELAPTGTTCGNPAAIFTGGNAAVGCNSSNAQSGGYTDNTTINEGPWCLIDGATYDIISRDSYGDGGTNYTVKIATFPLYSFTAGVSSETFSFVVNAPPAFDGAMLNFETPAYVFIGNIDLKGEIKNLGSTTIYSMDVNYTINGGATVTQNLSSLNIDPFTTYHYTHPTVWVPITTGAYSIELWISNINGQGADAVPSNDNLVKTINIKDPIPNIISSYTLTTNTFTYDLIVNSSDQISQPRDLDFHPNGDLWIINKGTENSGGSTVKVTNPGITGQSDLWKQDGNAYHFMSLPSAIAFSNNGNFATSTSVLDANHSGGSFTGPTLWSSDPLIYAVDHGPGTNGSHLDMLHESPYSMGIASEEENIFWVYDDYNNDIVMYDFVEDHGPGNSYHDDGRVLRYQGMGLNAMNHTIVNHLKLDDDKKWLYFVDGGNQRVLRLDITTGTANGSPSWGPQETLAEYQKMTGFSWEEVVTTGLTQPAGIDIIDDRLVVTDHSNGDIIFYDVSSIPAIEIGRLQTNEPGIMGIVLGPEGKIWYANHTLNKVVKIEPSTIILTATWDCNNGVCSDPGTGLGVYSTAAACVAACQITDIHEEISDLLIYPNPAKTTLTITGNYLSATIYDIFGKEAVQMSDFIKNTVDISHLSSGLYFVNIDDGKQKITKKLIIE